MRLLLDANIVIWLLGSPIRISPAVIRTLEDADNDLFVSTASLMEIAAKASTGRLIFDQEARQKVEAMSDWLPVTADHAWKIRNLPPIHKDPFDRVIVAQAMIEGMTLVTGDRILADYGVSVILT